ncbi:hypothetical protein PN499_16255 [Kamptonema animale CS-326]|uniref:hypothetical protein n=1 Tax=Kamptonema animale TaxID=92934 RepID=UPI00232F087C|nr:hypothetical protein [Kamptonema animale]MDB9512742.1 hypothetical protein [Kamptonema animale CS-326]
MKRKSTNSNVAVGKKLGLGNTAQLEYGYPTWAIIHPLTRKNGEFSVGKAIAQRLVKAKLLYFFTFRPNFARSVALPANLSLRSLLSTFSPTQTHRSVII